jgi:hypothetical protein
MAKKRHLPLRSAAMRFVATTAFAFSFYNPGGLHAVALLGSDALNLWPKLMVLTSYAAGALILGRLAWCGLDPFGRFVPLVLGVGVAVLLVDLYHFAPGILSYGSAVTFALLALCFVLTLGQVAAYYIRQISGQVLVLKEPP